MGQEEKTFALRERIHATLAAMLESHRKMTVVFTTLNGPDTGTTVTRKFDADKIRVDMEIVREGKKFSLTHGYDDDMRSELRCLATDFQFFQQREPVLTITTTDMVIVMKHPN